MTPQPPAERDRADDARQESPPAPSPPRAVRPTPGWARLTRTDLLVLVATFIGFAFFRRAFLLLAAGPAFWALSLMYCVIAGAALLVAVRSLRR